MTRIYLDNAATSWPKPESVYKAVDRFAREHGAAAGRGAYASAAEAGAVVRRVRQGIAKRIGADDPRRVVLTPGGTESLNLAIHGWVRPGDHVVTTIVEHNSVLRPLAWLRDHAGVRLSHVGCDSQGYVSPDDIAAAINSETRLVAVTHASNVTGAIQPIDQIAEVCHARGVKLLVDAAQSLGGTPIDISKTLIDFLAAPGHKKLQGPLGTGVLWVREGLESELQPTLQGGTGSQSESDQQPTTMPDRYESGNLNTPALAGLDAALRLAEQSAEDQSSHLQALTALLIEGLQSIAGATLIGPPAEAPRVEVVSIQLQGYDPHDAAAALATQGVECRAGLHCAGRLHEALGTAAGGGTIRFSPGWSTTPQDIEQTIDLVGTLAAHPL